MCIVYFFWTVRSEQEHCTQMQNHPLPTLWGLPNTGILCKVDTDVLPSAAPTQQGMLLLGLLRSPCPCLAREPLLLPYPVRMAAPGSAHLIYWNRRERSGVGRQQHPQPLQTQSWILVQFDSGENNSQLAEWPQSYRTPSFTSLNDVKLFFLHQTIIIHLVTYVIEGK